MTHEGKRNWGEWVRVKRVEKVTFEIRKRSVTVTASKGKSNR